MSNTPSVCARATQGSPSAAPSTPARTTLSNNRLPIISTSPPRHVRPPRETLIHQSARVTASRPRGRTAPSPGSPPAPPDPYSSPPHAPPPTHAPPHAPPIAPPPPAP